MIQNIDLRLPGLRVRRLRLNRHLPEVDAVSEHAHPFAQILCYLSGQGTMTAGGKDLGILPSAVVLLPKNTKHYFQETVGRRPLCLVVDFEMRRLPCQEAKLSRLNLSDVGIIKHELSELARIRDPNNAGCRLLVSAVALRVLDVLFRQLAVLPDRQKHTPPFVRQFDQLLRNPDLRETSISDLAGRMGYQSDYLNRAFKQATGQTLREYRNLLLLKRAKQSLGLSRHVGDASEQLGFSDQNYFSRWFKQHTGMQPRAYQSLISKAPTGKKT